jgi:hypothetical protein
LSWNPADIHAAKRVMRAALDATPDLDKARLTVEMSGRVAQLFAEFLHDLDPDMPPRPIMKALGPLVGDHMMNAKLHRLDELADKLGPLTIRLTHLVDDLRRSK